MTKGAPGNEKHSSVNSKYTQNNMHIHRHIHSFIGLSARTFKWRVLLLYTLYFVFAGSAPPEIERPPHTHTRSALFV